MKIKNAIFFVLTIQTLIMFGRSESAVAAAASTNPLYRVNSVIDLLKGSAPVNPAHSANSVFNPLKGNAPVKTSF